MTGCYGSRQQHASNEFGEGSGKAAGLRRKDGPRSNDIQRIPTCLTTIDTACCSCYVGLPVSLQSLAMVKVVS